jgi:hypothetical protein
MIYLRVIVGCYFLISSFAKIFTENDLIFIHSSSESYLFYKVILIIIELLIAGMILIPGTNKIGSLVGSVLTFPGLIIALLNILFFTEQNCQLGYLSGNPLPMFLQKAILLSLLIWLFKFSLNK